MRLSGHLISAGGMMETNLNGPRSEGRRGIPGLGTWSGIGLVSGLVSDFLQPLAPIATYLLAASLLLALLGILLRAKRWFRPHARSFIGAAAIGCVVFGGVVALQQFSTPEDKGKELGFLASFVAPIASVQRATLPVSEEMGVLADFRSAISSGSEVQRAASARNHLQSAQDPTLRRAMLETLIRSDEPALRQIALLAAFKANEGHALTVVPLEDSGRNPLAQALIGSQIYIRSVDEMSGALEIGFRSAARRGTIARDRVIMSVGIEVENRQRPLELDLRPTEDLRLAGIARTPESTTRIEIPLF